MKKTLSRLKKAASVVLALIMLFTVFPFSALAENDMHSNSVGNLTSGQLADAVFSEALTQAERAQLADLVSLYFERRGGASISDLPEYEKLRLVLGAALKNKSELTLQESELLQEHFGIDSAVFAGFSPSRTVAANVSAVSRLLQAGTAAKAIASALTDGSAFTDASISAAAGLENAAEAAAPASDQPAQAFIPFQSDQNYYTAPFQSGGATIEQVSTTDGSILLTSTDLVMPGPFGMNFTLSRTYNSAAAKYYGQFGEIGTYSASGDFAPSNVIQYRTFTVYTAYSPLADNYPFYPTASSLAQPWPVSTLTELSREAGTSNTIDFPAYRYNYDISNIGSGQLARDNYFSEMPAGTSSRNTALALSPYDNIFFAGTGWSFDFPFIESHIDDRRLTVHLGGGAQIEAVKYRDQLNKYYYKLLNSDVTRTFITEGIYSELGNKTGYKVIYGDANSAFFHLDGTLAKLIDRYGSVTSFTYPVVNGRKEIDISLPSGQLVRIYNQPTATGVNMYAELSDGSKITYVLTEKADKKLASGYDSAANSNAESFGGYFSRTSEYVLSAVIDFEGNETTYTYTDAEAKFDISTNKSDTHISDFKAQSGVNYIARLDKIEYCTGLSSNYEYLLKTNDWHSSGVEQELAVKRRYDQSGTATTNEKQYRYTLGSFTSGAQTALMCGHIMIPATSTDYMVNHDKALSTAVIDVARGTKDLFTMNYKTGLPAKKETFFCSGQNETLRSREEYNFLTYYEKTYPLPILTKYSVFDANGAAAVTYYKKRLYGAYSLPQCEWTLQNDCLVKNGSSFVIAPDISYYATDMQGSYITGYSQKMPSGIKINDTTVNSLDDPRPHETYLSELYYAACDQGHSKHRVACSLTHSVASYNYSTPQGCAYSVRTATISEHETQQQFGTCTVYCPYTGDADNLNYDQELFYDSAGLLKSARYYSPTIISPDPEEYTYDIRGNMLTSALPNNQTTSYTYDDNGNILSIVYPDGGAVNISYNYSQNKQTVTLPPANNGATRAVIKYDFDPAGNISLVTDNTDPANAYVMSSYAYDSAGRLVSESNNQSCLSGGTFFYAYDEFDRLVSRTAETAAEAELLKQTWSYEVNPTSGNYIVTETTHKDESDPFDKDIVSIKKYDRYGNLAYTDGPEGTASVVTDIFGRILQESSLFTTKYFYNAHEAVRVVNSGGAISRLYYDGSGKVGQSYVEGVKSTNHYTSDGRLHSSFVGDAVASEDGLEELYTEFTGRVEYIYNSSRQLIKTRRVSGPYTANGFYADTSYTYDPCGRIAVVAADVDGTQTAYAQYAYDKMGNIIKTYTGHSAPLTLDANGAVTSGTPKSVASYAYDHLGRLISETDSYGESTLYEYDKNGNLIKTTLRSGRLQGAEYDLLGRTTRIWYRFTPTTSEKSVNYVYYKSGGTKSATSISGGTFYRYDNKGRLTNETEATAQSATLYQNSYIYNVDNSLAKYTYSGVSGANNVLFYSYSYPGKLSSVSSAASGGTQYAAYSYDQNGRMTGNCGATYAYDSHGRIISETRGENIQTYAYTRDGNIISRVDSDGTLISYGYDRIGRLTYDGRTGKSYEYDLSGNRTKTILPNTIEETYTYDLCNRITGKYFDGSQNTYYYYDADGRLIFEGGVTGMVGTEYSYNVFGKPHRTTDAASGRYTQYDYNYATGARRSKKHYDGNGSLTDTTLFSFCGGNMVCENDAAGENIRMYVYANGVCARIDCVEAEDEFGVYDTYTVTPYTKNMLGDVTAFNGQNYTYNAFGEGIAGGGIADTNAFRYRGEYFDRESTTYYLRNRSYDPTTSRMLLPDPYWNPTNMIYGDTPNTYPIPNTDAIRQSTNLYAYALSNPLKYVDPNGLRTYIINGISNSEKIGPPQYSEDLKQALLDQGVQNVRTIGVYNGTTVLSGVLEVIKEMTNAGDYTDTVLNTICNDLTDFPLEKGEELNLIGYSGGGQIALNVAEKLSGKYIVNNTILIAAPVLELTLNNTGTTVSIWSESDAISFLSFTLKFHGVYYEFAGQIRHKDYFNSDNLTNITNIITKYIK